MPDHVYADPGFVRSAGAGGNDDSVGMQAFDLIGSRLIIASDNYVRPEFSQILDEVIREGIVII
jgi:hypothetical protein